ncbi:hypothetical protein V3C99_015303 [Haemonchus contortus]|uniref:Post-GPI attachment to proteins factor 3 n=1 Tax=Haemonchus contortus TaxID=6289 RepID=A0A7I4YWQ0_HAECO
MNWLVNVLFLGYGIYQVSGSIGDASWAYRSCTEECRKSFSCPERFDSCGWSSGPCFRCRYDCMWNTVDIFKRHDGFVPQFHGKWPFLALHISFLGLADLVIQEPASFVFSLLNFYSFYLLYSRIKLMRKLNSNHVWILYATTGLVTWLCSAIFHARDCWLTEYMDYFSAFAFILCASYVSFCFTYSWLGVSTYRMWWMSSIYGSLLLLWFTRHIYHMMKHFDYGYNMRCCIGVSMATTVMYMLYIASRWRTLRQLSSSDRMLIGMMVWANCSILLETLDFPPILWIFDAHSLFHAATVPLPLYLGAFLQQHLIETEYGYSKRV